MTEKQPYEVVKQFAQFELRHYPACNLASVTIRADFEKATNLGFYPLVNYIDGANQGSQKIAMTAPVLQEAAEGNEHVISFVLPKDFELDALPLPTNSKVTVHSEPEHHAVALKFSGTWSEKRFLEAAEKLKKAVAQSIGLGELSASVHSEVYFARFDPPWMPGFARRNEALMRVELGN